MLRQLKMKEFAVIAGDGSPVPAHIFAASFGLDPEICRGIIEVVPGSILIVQKGEGFGLLFGPGSWQLAQ